MTSPIELVRLAASPFSTSASASEKGMLESTFEKFFVSMYRAVFAYITDGDKRLSGQHIGVRESVCYG